MHKKRLICHTYWEFERRYWVFQSSGHLPEFGTASVYLDILKMQTKCVHLVVGILYDKILSSPFKKFMIGEKKYLKIVLDAIYINKCQFKRI